MHLIKTSIFYSKYRELFTEEVLHTASYICHELFENDFENENQKFSYAKSLLNIYAKSKLVITSRIHSALPCLALETPVIYINKIEKNEASSCRLDGLISLLNVVSLDNNKLIPLFNIPKRKIDINSTIHNNNIHIRLKENLITMCKDFIGC